MAGTAEKDDPKLWDKVKKRVTKSDKGGKPGQWSARKAQLATHDYKEEGGGYKGRKSADNHLDQWTKEDWGTKSGEKSEDTGERYLPKAAREEISDREYQETSDRKRADTKKGKQHSTQPEKIADKTARHRDTGRSAKDRTAASRKGDGKYSGRSRSDLYAEAKKRDIPGRSKMSKALG